MPGAVGPAARAGGRFLYGAFQDEDGETLDEGLCLVFRAPHSYTGEDVAELQSHGSPAVLARLLGRVLEVGARAARPGEFTLRAYLGGRLDLTQAEAVLSLVNAQTDAARRQAALGLSGAIAVRVAGVAEDVTRTLAAIQAMLDYPEEGVPEEEREEPLAAPRPNSRRCSAPPAPGRSPRAAHGWRCWAAPTPENPVCSMPCSATSAAS